MKNFFPHDHNARTDPKILHLKSVHGEAGYGMYWDIVEMLYEEGGYLMRTQCDGIAMAMHTDRKTVDSILDDFNLFVSDEDKFTSTSVQRRIGEIESRSKAAKESANKRWAHRNSSDAFAMRSQCEGNALKEKEKEKKDRRTPGVTILNPLKERSPVNTLKAYFSEKFKERTQSEYPCNHAKDGKLLETLLETQTPEKVKEMMDAFFTSRDDFIQKAGYSIGVFSSVYSKLVSKAAPKQTQNTELTPLQLHALKQA